MPLLRALSSICSATIQLPHAVVLSDGLEKCGGIAVVSGGFTDTWRGQYRTKPVAIKVLRDYPIQDLKEAKKVRHTILVNVVSFFTIIVGSMEGVSRMEETVSWTPPAIPWCRRVKL